MSSLDCPGSEGSLRGSGRSRDGPGAFAFRMPGVLPPLPPVLRLVALDADAVVGQHLDLAVILQHPGPARVIAIY